MLKGGGGSGVAFGFSTLINGLIDYWSLDEESGIRNDSVGIYPLTPGGAIEPVPGIHGNAARFASNSDLLESADIVTTPPSRVTIALWAQLIAIVAGTNSFESLTNYLQPLGQFSRWHSGVIFSGQDRQPHFSVGNGATSYQVVHPASMVLGKFELIICSFDDLGDRRPTISINDGSPVVGSTPLSGTWYADNLKYIMSKNTGAADTVDIDEIAVWNRILTAAERTELYNNGHGKFYPF